VQGRVQGEDYRTCKRPSNRYKPFHDVPSHVEQSAARSPVVGASGAAYLPDLPAPPIAREGMPILLGILAGSVVVSAVSYFSLHSIGQEHLAYPVMAVSAMITLWCAWFFRDPARKIPADPSAIISPADGVVCLVDAAAPPPELGLGPQPMSRVCVFMNVFNVHVNRSPAGGMVERLEHRQGKFINASLDKASEDNERLAMLLRLSDGRPLPVVQIAGLIARRIVCRAKVGDVLTPGQRYGLIRFGSRVDVYLPPGTRVLVRVGEKAVAGETVIGRLE
jgi:phosphatidylserine decarboxylase